MKISEQKFGEIDKMLRGISWKYSNSYEFDDLYQECWYKTLLILEGYENPEEVSLNLIASSCYNRIYDLLRYSNRRTNQIAVDQDESVFSDKSESTGLWSSPADNGQKVFDKLAIEDLLKVVAKEFGEDSREVLYVQLVATYIGSIEVSKSEYDAIFGDDDAAMEQIVAVKLNYASSMSSGYRRLKGRVRNLLESQKGGQVNE